MVPPSDETLPPPPTPQPPTHYSVKDKKKECAIDTILDFFSSNGLSYCVVAMFIEPLETNDGLIYMAYSLKNGSISPGKWTEFSRFVVASVDNFMRKSPDIVPVGLVLSSFDTKKYLDVTRRWMAHTKTRKGFNNKMAILGKKLVSGETGRDTLRDLVSPWAHPYFIKTLSMYIDSSLAVTIGGKAFYSGKEIPANSHSIFGGMIRALTPPSVGGRMRFNAFKDGIDEEKDMLLSEKRATENITSNNSSNRSTGRKKKRQKMKKTSAAAVERRDRSPLSSVIAYSEDGEEESSPHRRRIPSFIINIAPGHETPELEAAFPKTFIYTKSLASAVVNETK